MIQKALRSWRTWAGSLKRELRAIALAYRDPRVPWYARLVAACVVAYALSPLDLIPDPIPVLGYLDDLLLLPLGIALVIRLIPPAVLEEHRRRAAQTESSLTRPQRWIAAALIVAAWLALAALALVLVRQGGG